MFRNFGITANRGLAYCDNKLFELTLDMRLIAINPSDGSLAQQIKISDAVPDAEGRKAYMAGLTFRTLSAAKAARALQDGGIGGVIADAGRVVVPAKQALNAVLEFIE